jgi:hypothetical protein
MAVVSRKRALRAGIIIRAFLPGRPRLGGANRERLLDGDDRSEPTLVGNGGNHRERRADPRSAREWVKLTFRGFDHVALNWSASGALVEDRHPEIRVGERIPGLAMFGGSPCRFRFCAEIVRRHAEERTLALRFVDLSPALRLALRYPTGI